MFIKKAFTLVELSVVIVIISIMLSTVLVSRSLIDSAKVNKIYEDYRNLDRAIILFINQYDCLPGDCTAKQIPNLINNLSAICTVDNIVDSASNIKIGTGAIESTVKRACMMHSLYLAGLIDSLDPTYNSATQLLETVAGKTVPYAKFSNSASWNFRRITSGWYSDNFIGSYTMPVFPGFTAKNTDALVMPVEINYSNDLPNTDDPYIRSLSATNVTYHSWILHSANKTFGNTNPLFDDVADIGRNIRPAVSAKLASKLDLKFDDGLPYRGKILGGKSLLLGWNDNFCNNGASGPTTVNKTMGSVASYINSNSLKQGCIVVFIGNYNIT